MNDANVLKIEWRTTGLFINDPTSGQVELKALGECVYRINDENINREQLEEQLTNEIRSCVSSITVKNTNCSRKDLEVRIRSELFETLNSTYPHPEVTLENASLMSLRSADSEPVKDTEQVKIVKTDEGAKDGQTKCPKCGATDISLNVNNGKLRCNFCRHEFEQEKVSGLVEDISTLEGQVMGSGAQDIIADTNDVLTFKCSSCGAEVVIDTASAPQARCHWCRNTLSVNQQIPNGAIPDVVLPFGVKKEDARAEIEKFVGKRKFFAHPKFKQEFTTENIMGVYFPYMLVDVNGHASFSGEGEHQTRKYYVGSGDKQEARYDADLYHVEREFDITINGLSVESNSDRLNTTSKEKTNNIINSIMPFDTENCVKYNSNYLKGYTSEKRDTNVEQLKNIVDTQSQDIARFGANDSLELYDRGVRWDNESFSVKGQQWQAAYLPVWLYSYQQVDGNKKLLHYVAVNARTKETMGSVPIHMPKLILFSFLIEVLCFILMLILDWDNDFIVLAGGIIFFIIMYAKYRNSGARHTYEVETKRNITDLRQVDDFIKSKTGLTTSVMSGANNKSLGGANALSVASAKHVGSTVLNAAVDSNPLASLVKKQIKK